MSSFASLTKNELKEQQLLTTIGPLKILPYSYDIAVMAGNIFRDLEKPIAFVDAAIAASAIFNGFKLATTNKKDFENIEEIEFLDY